MLVTGLYSCNKKRQYSIFAIKLMFVAAAFGYIDKVVSVKFYFVF